MNHVDELISTLACKRHEEHELNKKLDHLDCELRSLGGTPDEAHEAMNRETAALQTENTELRKRIAILEV
jgi:hypothetical protein